jgi:hypothetical protein
MDPVTTITTALPIAKTAAEILKKLFEFGKGLKDHEMKQKLDEITDQVRELKQSASQLEDQNRELREKLRFKSDEYEFRNPFRYHKAHPDQPLCPKCFADERLGPMGAPYYDGLGRPCRICLVCNNVVELGPAPSRPDNPGPSGPNSWMAR